MKPQPLARLGIVLALCGLLGGGCIFIDDKRALALYAATAA